MTLQLHISEPIQTQRAGNTLAAVWMPHCSCGWSDPAHLCDTCADTDYFEHEHWAHCPDMWPAPPAA